MKQWISMILLVCCSMVVYAQTDTVTYSNKEQSLQALETQRKADSTAKVKLEQELAALQSTNSRGKEDLEKKLAALEEKEARQLALKKARIDSLRATVKAFPVLGFFEDTLFNVYTRSGSFSAEERAQAATQRIRSLTEDYFFTADSLQLVEAEAGYDIMAYGKIVFNISEADAIWNNSTTSELAEKYKNIIAQEVLKYKAATNWEVVLKEIGMAFLVIALLAVIIYFSNKLFKWLGDKLGKQENKLIRGIKIKNYTFIDAKHEVKLIATLLKLVKWLFILVLVYITLPILFGIFPWTKNIADTLFGFILNPLKAIAVAVWNYLPNLFTIVVIIVVFRFLLRGVRFLKLEIERGALNISGFYPDWANPTYHIVRVLLLAFMFILIYPYLPGSDSPVFKGVSVFLGVLFTFGSSGSLSNLVAGLVLTYMRAFKLGDRVKIGDVTGDIIEKSLLVTRIRTIKNEIISIPNSNVMASHTINYSSDANENGLIINTTVTIGYDVPWRKMHETLIEAANRTELLLKEPKPFVLQTSLEDFYVAYQINAYTCEANKQALIYSQLHQNIQDCCNEVGIEIMSPHYCAARDGNTTTIPENYLDKNYQSPSFKVRWEKDKNTEKE